MQRKVLLQLAAQTPLWFVISSDFTKHDKLKGELCLALSCVMFALIVMQVFRAWTQNTDELVQERPHKLLRPILMSQYPGCRQSAAPSGAELLSGAPLSAMFGQGGKWSEDLQSLFVSSMTPGTAQGRTPGVTMTHICFSEWARLTPIVASMLLMVFIAPMGSYSRPFAFCKLLSEKPWQDTRSILPVTCLKMRTSLQCS